MSRSPATRPSLLVRIRDSADQQAWHEFVDIYAPLVHAYTKKRGMQEADAADLTQDVMQTVAREAGSFSYDPARGSFRGWLLTITLNRLRDFVEQRNRQAIASGGTTMQCVLQEVPDDQAAEVWNQQHQWRLFHWAAEQARIDFREPTWQAFWTTAVENKTAKDTAAELGISVGAVHIAKSRVLSRIRDILKDIED